MKVSKIGMLHIMGNQFLSAPTTFGKQNIIVGDGGMCRKARSYP